ncbi:acidic mammalian chitinase-like [Herrania umbratica]|uniref:Acidic mammalian chitinase-like n=1 Tax=Herrania umbratica TaxID=108875 RepID=A0A6J0ZR03_9ROSI|nr:acidic mammalian chitinase-like [Herrania umbratica]
MAGLTKTYFQLFSFLIVFLIVPTRLVMALPPAVKAAYWPSWTTTFPPSAIDTSLFTHIYYAFLMPSNVTYTFEIPSSTAHLLSNFTTTLHHKKPLVKTLFSIGGGGADPLVFSRMASEAKTRKAFINSAIEVARKFGFDGMDLDWEFPKNPKDMQDLGILFTEWRQAINYEAKASHRAPLLLTAAVYFSVDFFLDEVYRKYPVSSMNQNLDWVSAMCFDYHGGWDTSKTGAHAVLYDPNSNVSTSYGLRSWIKAGVPRSKLVMGLPLYGRTWQLKDPNSHGIGSAAVAVGPGDNGVLTFVQVEKFNKKNDAKVVHDMETVSTYSYVGSTWIGYDDALSTTLKIGFAQALGIRGYFFWALSFDNEWKISRQASRAWVLGE